MTIFELWGSIGLKTQAFTEGLSAAVNDIKKFESNIGSVISAAKKVDNAITSISDAAVKGAASIVTGTIDIAKAVDQNVMGVVNQAAGVVVEGFQQMAAAGVEFFKDAVREGIEFDASMGQVSATMMKSKEEFDEITVSVGEFTGTLTEYAQKLGAETIFTSTQVGEAMNYITLSGRKAQETAELLPHTLDLAAAGTMGLGDASEMVTQAVNALGLEEEDVTRLIDQMAMTSTNSGTTIAQLGDGILAIGATARDLKGGITELNTALGVLADNGLQASEGGNMLRRVLTRLTTGDSAATMLETLGVSAYDAQGNMKGLPDIFMELNQAMAGFTTQQRKSAITDIFGQYSLAGANALLNTTTERWQNLTSAIENSEGAAAKVAEVQRATLQGQIMLLDSAISGVKINLFDKVAGISKEFVETLSTGLSNVAQEIKEGNFFEAFMELGGTAVNLIKKGVTIVLENSGTIDEIIYGAVGFIEKVGSALFEGGSELMPRILGHLLYFSQRAIASFSEFLSSSENLLTIERTITHMFDQISTFLDENRDNLYIIFSTLFDVAIQFVDDIFVLKRETVYSILYEKFTDILADLVENIGTYLTSEELTQAVDNVISFIDELAQTLLDSSTEILPPILRFVLDIAGKVIEGAADFLSDEKNIETIRASLNLIISSIDGFLHEHAKDFYKIIETLWDIGIGLIPKVFKLKRQTTAALISKKIGELLKAAWFEEDVASSEANGIGINIVDGIADGTNTAPTWIQKKFRQSVLKILGFFTEGFDIHSPSRVFRDQVGKPLIEGLWQGVSDMQNWLRDNINPYVDNIVEAFKGFDLIQVGSDLVSGLWQGISDARDWLIEKIGGFTDDVVNSFKDFFGIQSPSKVMENSVGKFLAQGVGVGFEAEMDKVAKNMQAAVPIDFNIQTSSIKVPKAAAKNINLSVNIEKFVNNSDDDINHLASKLSSMLRNEIYSDMAAVN